MKNKILVFMSLVSCGLYFSNSYANQICKKMDYIGFPPELVFLSYCPQILNEIKNIKMEFDNNEHLNKIHERRVIDVDEKKLHIEFLIDELNCKAIYKRIVSNEDINNTLEQLNNVLESEE